MVGMKSTLIITLVSFLLIGCTSRRPAGFLTPSEDRIIRSIPWTEKEKAADIAILEVRRGNWASHHVARLAGAEKPHVHQRHDATVTLLRGKVLMHLGDRVFTMHPGDIVDIPHGQTHWAKNALRSGASEAYIVFTPPYDGTDSTPATP